jgi:hypothetical protein
MRKEKIMASTTSLLSHLLPLLPRKVTGAAIMRATVADRAILSALHGEGLLEVGAPTQLQEARFFGVSVREHRVARDLLACRAASTTRK